MGYAYSARVAAEADANVFAMEAVRDVEACVANTHWSIDNLLLSALLKALL